MKSAQRAWWKKTFNQDYLDIYGPHLEVRTAMEVAGLQRLCPLESGAAILDLGCGHGRHSVELAKLGYQVTGIDQSNVFLERAHQRGMDAGASVDWVHSCYSKLSWKNRFDLVISMYHSFGYCDDEAEQEQLLRKVVRALRPGGHFVIDLWGMQQLEPHLGHHRVELPEYLFEEEVSLTLLESRLDPDGEQLHRLDVNQTLTRPGQPSKHYLHQIRLYTPEQLKAKLVKVGFEEIEMWGNFDGTPLPDGDRLIARARKPLRSPS